MIIGLAGKKGSGKDTVARYFIQRYGFIKLSFAQWLKESIKVLFGFTDQQLEDPALKETQDARWQKSPRQIMQWLGTDVLRDQFRSDFHVTRMHHQLESMLKCNPSINIIITDVRFENEAKMIREMGGSIIHIVRNSNSVDSHTSEAGISIQEGELVLKNNKSIESLYQTVESIICDQF